MADSTPASRNASIVVTPDTFIRTRENGPRASDPTALTTMALANGIAGLKEILSTRLDAMDKAIELLQDRAKGETPISVIEERVNSLTTLNLARFAAVEAQQFERFASVGATNAEKFDSIQVQFRERDVRTEQTSRDAKTAVDAALQAAKEAVGEQNKSGALAIAKSETSTIKQIDQIAILLQNVNKATDDKISDLKDRLTMIEGRSGGQGSLIAYLFAGLGLVGTLTGAVYAITHR